MALRLTGDPEYIGASPLTARSVGVAERSRLAPSNSEFSSHPSSKKILVITFQTAPSGPAPPNWRTPFNKDHRQQHVLRKMHLARVAGKMWQTACLSKDAVRAAVLKENAVKCKPPLPEVEVEKIVTSVTEYTPSKRPIDDRRLVHSLPKSILGASPSDIILLSLLWLQ
jgi:hypothetical protein